MKKLAAFLLALMMMTMAFSGVAEELFPGMEATGAAALVEDALAAGRKVTSTVKLSDWPAGLTGEESIDAAINDLLDALTITTTQQGDETSFALNLSGNDVLTFGLAQSGSDAYINSNLLGGTIVVGADEVQPLLERLIDLFVMMGAFSEDEAAEIKAQLGEAFEAVKSELGSMGTMPEFNFDITTLNLSALQDVITLVSGKMVIGEVTMQPKNCDPATVMATMTITPDEFKTVMNAIFKFMQDNTALVDAVDEMISFQDLVAAEGKPMTLNEAIAEAAKEVETTDFLAGDMVVNFYMNDAGEIVAVNGVIPDKNEDGEVVNLEFNYVRLTMNEDVTHSVTLKIENVTLTVNVLVNENRLYVGFNMVDEETTVYVTVDTTSNETDAALNYTYAITFGVTDPELSMEIAVNGTSDYTVNGVDFVGKEAADVLFNGMKLLHIECDTVTGEPGTSIMTGDVVRPAELNDSDFANWFVGIINGLQSWLGTAVMSLPESVLMLVMGSM